VRASAVPMRAKVRRCLLQRILQARGDQRPTSQRTGLRMWTRRLRERPSRCSRFGGLIAAAARIHFDRGASRCLCRSQAVVHRSLPWRQSVLRGTSIRIVTRGFDFAPPVRSLS